MRKVIASIMLTLVLFGVGSQAQATWRRHITITVPRCEEDEIYVGKGDYDGTRWDRYACVPRDNFDRRHG